LIYLLRSKNVELGEAFTLHHLVQEIKHVTRILPPNKKTIMTLSLMSKKWLSAELV
jgi:hypothetical protein